MCIQIYIVESCWRGETVPTRNIKRYPPPIMRILMFCNSACYHSRLREEYCNHYKKKKKKIKLYTQSISAYFWLTYSLVCMMQIANYFPDCGGGLLELTSNYIPLLMFLHCTIDLQHNWYDLSISLAFGTPICIIVGAGREVKQHVWAHDRRGEMNLTSHNIS